MACILLMLHTKISTTISHLQLYNYMVYYTTLASNNYYYMNITGNNMCVIACKMRAHYILYPVMCPELTSKWWL